MGEPNEASRQNVFFHSEVLLFQSNIKDMKVMKLSAASQWAVEYFHGINYINELG